MKLADEEDQLLRRLAGKDFPLLPKNILPVVCGGHRLPWLLPRAPVSGFGWPSRSGDRLIGENGCQPEGPLHREQLEARMLYAPCEAPQPTSQRRKEHKMKLTMMTG